MRLETGGAGGILRHACIGELEVFGRLELEASGREFV